MAEAADQEQIATLPWRKEKLIGTGGFGTVTLWSHKDTGDTIALKKCRWGAMGTGGAVNILTPKHIERWEKEVEIMNKLSHPAVIKCFPVPTELVGTSPELPMICMEYCSGGDLRKILNKPENCCGLREVAVRNCLRDMTDAIAYLHSMRIYHRDLKPENIVLQNNEGIIKYKLIDLGYAKELEQNSVCTSFVGTLQYLAPELFLSKKYSCTVDYWSLGLVTHEIITGIRPFLPNMTPVQWMKRVRSKQSDHICVYEGRNGDIQFSSHLFPECHISTPFKHRIENWLRIMLEWEPANRGQKKDESGENKVVAFTMVNEMLTKQMIKVFVVNTCQLLEYEISNTTSLTELQEWIANDSNMTLDDQCPLLPRGQPPDPKRTASQCWAPADEDEWLLYIFSESVTPPHARPEFPQLVNEMLRQPKTSVNYPTQRRMWAHAVFFLHREARLSGLLGQAQKVSMMHLMTGHAQLARTGQKMLSDIAKLQARHNLFMESLNSDLENFEEQEAAGRITSARLFSGWREMGEITMRQVHANVEQVQKINSSLTALATRITELQCSPFSRARAGDSFDTILVAGHDLYNNLKHRSKEQRSQSHDNTEMCKLLLQALKKRDKLHQDLYKNLEKQCEHLNEVANLSTPLESVLQDIARSAQNISSLQKQRQRDIWKIIEMCVMYGESKKDNNNTASSTPTTTPSPQYTMAPTPPASLSTVHNLLEKSYKESDALISENRSLRCQMIDILSSNINPNLLIERPGPDPTSIILQQSGLSALSHDGVLPCI